MNIDPRSVILRITAHLNIAILVTGILFYLKLGITPFYGILVIVTSILIDLDYLLSKFFTEKDHRRYFTHSILIWFSIMVFSELSNNEYLFWITIGALIHLTLDLIDFGLPIIPHKKNIPFTPHILPIEEKTVEDSLRTAKFYWKNNLLLTIEIIAAVLGLVTIFFLPYEMQMPLLVLAVLIYLHLYYFELKPLFFIKN